MSEAGGNALLRIEANGKTPTLAVFRTKPPTDAVPTGLTVGPCGAYYVGELTGAPFTEGAAHIYRVVPGFAPEIFLDGFKTIMDIAFGPEGSLYVVQFATGPTFFNLPGQLIRVHPDGTRKSFSMTSTIRRQWQWILTTDPFTLRIADCRSAVARY